MQNPAFSGLISRVERAKGTGNLPMGRASIASRYTPSAGTGSSRLSPRPPKGGVSRAKTITESRREREITLKKKTMIITARLTPGEKTVIQKRAKKAKMTMTAYIIQCALGKEIVQVDGLGEILSELKAQGRKADTRLVMTPLPASASSKTCWARPRLRSRKSWLWQWTMPRI